MNSQLADFVRLSLNAIDLDDRHLMVIYRNVEIVVASDVDEAQAVAHARLSANDSEVNGRTVTVAAFAINQGRVRLPEREQQRMSGTSFGERPQKEYTDGGPPLPAG